jgi:hypothetical protein
VIATQLPLFGDAESRPSTAHRGGVSRYRHVLHEPAVAESTARNDRLGCDLRSGWASFWSKLSAEQRQELRSRVAA